MRLRLLIIGLITLLISAFKPPQILTSPDLLHTSWLAHPDRFDYLQAVTLQPDGHGDLVWGDHQVIRHDEKFTYTLRPQQAALFLPLTKTGRYDLQFTGDEGRQYQGQLTLNRGPFPFEREGPGRGKITFEYRLRFSKCPFGYLKSLDYYGHQHKN